MRFILIITFIMVMQTDVEDEPENQINRKLEEREILDNPNQTHLYSRVFDTSSSPHH